MFFFILGVYLLFRRHTSQRHVFHLKILTQLTNKRSIIIDCVQTITLSAAQ